MLVDNFSANESTTQLAWMLYKSQFIWYEGDFNQVYFLAPWNRHEVAVSHGIVQP